ncbi:MAG: protein-glutamate O-methyltransferase CheR [Proteobacteria bacterium]|nr:protein-glutamate O-methyltransferase CheR [Pseudomonadota bacterium]
MSDGEFARLSAKVLALTGIELPPHKRQLVISRLRKRLRALGIDGFGNYLAYLASPAGEAESSEMVNAVTTNQTGFFRERHHFEDLAQILARRPGDAGGHPRRRIWSAACSTGEEPYSIAITALGAGLAGPGAGLRILATDLDTAALARARAATYPAGRADACPPQFRQGYFETLPGGQLRVAASARRLITFNQLNLHGSWPVQGPFDAIFCRNVLIYFSPEAKLSIVERFVDLLHPGGTLYLGHSEAMLGNHPQLVNQGRTIFRKCA